MISLLLHLLRLLPVLCGRHRQLALENLALRRKLAVYKRMITRPRLRGTDRLFWAAPVRIWAGWRQSLLVVTPDTVLQWQRRRFREYWTKLSSHPTGGRPTIHGEIKALITRMATANPLWGAPRIHGELPKLGLDVSERSVARLIPRGRLSALLRPRHSNLKPCGGSPAGSYGAGRRSRAIALDECPRSTAEGQSSRSSRSGTSLSLPVIQGTERRRLRWLSLSITLFRPMPRSCAWPSTKFLKPASKWRFSTTGGA
jgi:hypothetical protein